MGNNEIEIILREKGVKSTSNRITVYRTLQESDHPLSMSELEQVLPTLDKSSIFRVLTLFHQHDVVHTIDAGGGALKYEVCHAAHGCDSADMHVHFVCERCQRVFCMEQLPIPRVRLPRGYSQRTVNYIIKGVCPNCM